MNTISFTYLPGMRVQIAIVIGAVCLFFCADAQAQAVPLINEHRSWLETEVAQIISSAERDYFLTLKSDSDRNAFMEAFWLVRDPTPGTTRNEFREEHLRRLVEVNRLFGNMLWPGTATVRGRVFIRLGKPVQIIKYNSPELTSNMEAWLYPPDRSAGIRYNFYILFYRPESKGDLEPYCPGDDEPDKLLKSFADDAGRASQEEALRKLFEIDPLLGQLSLSLLPIEHRPIMINNRFDLRRALSRRNSHARKLIKMLLDSSDSGQNERLARIKRIMAGKFTLPKIRYTKARMNAPYRFYVLRRENGRPHVIFSLSINGERLAVSESYGKCYALLEVGLAVYDENGSLAEEKNETISASIDPWSLHNGNPGDLIYQTALDLPPGNYRIEAEIRSPFDGIFYLFSDSVTVPPVPSGKMEVSEPILLLDNVNASEEDNDVFAFFGENYFPANDQYIEKGTDASFYFQLYFPRRDRTSTVEVRYILRSEGKLLWDKREHLNSSNLRPGGFFSRKVTIPSGNYPTGVYSFEIVASALSPPEARASVDFTMQESSASRSAPTLASIERKGP